VAGEPRIIIRPRADRDLDEHVKSITRDNLKAARRFYDAAAEAFEQLVVLPKMGAPKPIEIPLSLGSTCGPSPALNATSIRFSLSLY
jgi:plasmid stabilization system protein ParE